MVTITKHHYKIWEPLWNKIMWALTELIFSWIAFALARKVDFGINLMKLITLSALSYHVIDTFYLRLFSVYNWDF